jgi:hypothetical protein
MNRWRQMFVVGLLATMGCVEEPQPPAPTGATAGVALAPRKVPGLAALATQTEKQPAKDETAQLTTPSRAVDPAQLVEVVK